MHFALNFKDFKTRTFRQLKTMLKTSLFSIQIVSWIFHFIRGSICCLPPDYPENGYYEPAQKKYHDGDKIVYSCRQDYIISGKETSYCLEGIWTEKSPFCDAPTKVNVNVQISTNFYTKTYSDGNQTKTCHASTRKATGQVIRLCLWKSAVIHTIRFYLPKGSVSIDVFLIGRFGKYLCSSLNAQFNDPQLITMKCPDHIWFSSCISVQNKSPVPVVLSLCNPEVVTKEDFWCSKPPDLWIPNGRLFLKRGSATLSCMEGYRPAEFTRIICVDGIWQKKALKCEEILCNKEHSSNSSEGGNWYFTTGGQKPTIGSFKELQCGDGFVLSGSPNIIQCLPNGTWTKTSATCKKSTQLGAIESKIKEIIIACSTVVSIVVIAGFVLMVYFVRKKSKPVVVVLRPGADVPRSLNEHDYSTVSYDNMPSYFPLNTLPALPKSRPPVDVLEEYSNPNDGQPPPYYNHPNYTDPYTAESSTSSIDLKIDNEIEKKSFHDYDM